MKFQVAGAQNLKHCDAGALRAGTASERRRTPLAPPGTSLTIWEAALLQ